MPKVMMPVEVEIGNQSQSARMPVDVNIVFRKTSDKWGWFISFEGWDDFGDYYGNHTTEVEALAAAKEWVLANGGSWEEEDTPPKEPK